MRSISGGDAASISGGDIASISGGDIASISGGDAASISGGDIASISGGDAASISGGDIASISGGDVASISGGDIASISGGDAASISGGDIASISGGDIASISGGDIASISGGDIAGISGGDTASISGGDIASISGGDIASISGGDAASISGGDHNILVVGPIDSLDRANGTFNTLGQTVSMPGGVLGDLIVGDYVFVGGDITGPGTIAASDVGRVGGTYVPGASEVFVTGIPSSVDFARGTATMGGLTFDYSPTLGGDAFEGIGAAVTVIGTQPALGGTLIGNAVLDKTELFLGD